MTLAFIGPVVTEERIFEDGRRTDAWLYYKLTYESNGSGEQKAEDVEKLSQFNSMFMVY